MRSSLAFIASSLLFVLPVGCSHEAGAEDPTDAVESSVTTAVRLKDLRTETRFFRRFGAEPSRVFAVNGTALFFAKTGRTKPGPGEQGLYETDGTRSGTKLVTKLAASPWGAPAVFADRFYFITSEYGLQRSDGTAAGTAPVPGLAQPEVRVQAVAAAPNALYVATVEETSGSFLVRLSKLTRNTNSSDSLESLYSAPIPDRWAYPQIAVNATGGVLFAARGTVVRTDGDAASTVVVATDRKIGSLFAATKRFFFTEPSATASGASELFEVIERPPATPGPRTRGYGPAARPNRAATAVEKMAALGDAVVLFTKSEMWTVDTTAGTVAAHVHDFTKGVSTAVHNGKLYALDGNGVLVETDGTVAGTTEDTTAATPSWMTSVSATDLVAHAGALHFIQATQRTQQIVRVAGGTKTVVSSFPIGAQLQSLQSIGGKLYVAAGGSGKELWSVDATSSRMLEVNPFGNASSDPAPFVATTQKTFFTVNEDVDWFATENGTEQTLWTTDGTSGGTTKLRTGLYSFHRDRYRTPAAVSVAAKACILEQRQFKTYIVCTDGTTAGTMEDSYAYEQAPVVLGDGVYYVRWGSSGDGQDVMRYDATFGTSSLVASLPARSVVRDIVARDLDVMFMVESPDAAARGIWTSDGTTSGTIRMVPNVAFIGKDERVLGRIGNDVFVAAPSATGGGALYKTDGSATGTVLVANIPYDAPPSFPAGRVVGSKLVFPVKGALWVTEGTAQTTAELVSASATGDSFYNYQADADGRLAFTTGRAIVVTDGTHAGTSRRVQSGLSTVAGIPSRGFVASSYDAKNLFLLDGAGGLTPLETNRGTYMNFAPLAVNGGLVFPGPIDDKGTELLFTDGSVNGTRVVTEIVQGAASSNPERLHIGRGRLWFSAEDANADRELYSVPLSGVN